MTEVQAGVLPEIESLIRRASVISEWLDKPVIGVPEGCTLQKLDPLLENPRRVVETITLHSIQDFIDYLKRWKLPATVVFADQEKRTLRSLIDFHEDNSKPRWADHSALYTAKLSREAEAWIGENGQGMDQATFADFLEERAIDVKTPSGSELLTLATNLQVISKVTFGSLVKLATGEFDLKYSEDQQHGSVKLPEKFILGIPLYHKGPAYQLEARLRYRVRDGKVVFIYKLVDLEAAQEHAFNEIVNQVKAELADIQVYQGTRK